MNVPTQSDFVVVLSDSVLVIEGCSNSFNALHCSVRSMLLQTDAMDPYLR